MGAMNRLIPILAGLAVAGSAAAAESPILPGYWESTDTVASPFHSTKTQRRCISPADVDRFLTGPINHHYTCVYPTRRVADGKLVMKGVCTDNKGRQVQVDASGSYTTTSFHVDATMGTRLLGMMLSGRATTDARRIGDACPAPQASAAAGR